MYTQERGEKQKEISRFSSPYDQPMAERPISVRLTVEMDEYVRSLPNRTEWLREAIAEKIARETQQESA